MASSDTPKIGPASESQNVMETASPQVVMEPNEDEQKPLEQHSGQEAGQHKVVVVIAGMGRSGKSTVLNNLFGANFNAIASADSVTKVVDLRRTKGDKGELIIVDTPGFSATDLPTTKVKKELDRTIKYLDCVLIYCYSVSPCSCQSVADELVVKNLQKVLGNHIWNKCVVLFTFSDLLRAQEDPNVENEETYKALIHRHAERFSEMLKKKCGKKVPIVKSIFDTDLDQEEINHIVAVPVGREVKQTKEMPNLVPDIEDANWLDTALLEIIRKADKENRGLYLDHIYKKQSIVRGGAASGIGAGLAIGAAGGVVFGAATLGLGSVAIPVGAVIGAVVGGAVGATGGLSVQKLRHIILEGRRKERLLKLESAQLIERKPVDKQSEEPKPSTEPQRISSRAKESRSSFGISDSTYLRERPDSTRYSQGYNNGQDSASGTLANKPA